MTEISDRTEFISTYSPDSDGIAERAHQMILKIPILQISMNWDFENMLNDFGMKGCKPDSGPAVPGSKLRKPGDKITSPDNEEASYFPYKEAVGGLLWFARHPQCSKPSLTV